MTRSLKGEYITFLQQFGPMENFFKFLLNVATEMSASPDEHLVSSLLLELKADYIREASITSKVKGVGRELAGGGTIFSSEHGNQVYIMRAPEPDSIFYFKTFLQFGNAANSFFEGPLLESDPVNNQNGIFLLQSSKLVEP